MADNERDPFFENPVLNSPYEKPSRYWHLDAKGQPTGAIDAGRRRSTFLTPVARAKHVSAEQGELELPGVVKGEDGQTYDSYDWINRIREAVASWRKLPESQWGVTPETARLLNHWRHYDFPNIRPFFCQIEAAEVVIWLTEVAARNKKLWADILAEIKHGNEDANPGLDRLALKLATGTGKTTVMAMLIAWQTVNAVRHPDSRMFTKGFLVVAPGITIKDRLRVLQPNDPDAYYEKRDLIPRDFYAEIRQARIVITNYHVFKLKDKLDLASGTRNLLQGRTGADLQTLESEGEMLQRVMPSLLGLKSVMVINDEAHHCYREKPETDEDKLDRDEKASVDESREMARVWISGLEALRRRIGGPVIDLSATPFFLRGSGYQEGTLFPWTVCDFSLMDAIECGIVKLPRVPVADNAPHAPGELPTFRNLWACVGPEMPKKNRAGLAFLDPSKLPPEVINAIDNLYDHYVKTSRLWDEKKMPMPPCFIFVCQNTAISKLVYDFVSGYRTSGGVKDGHCPLFSNFDSRGEPLARPNTILVDSMELESGEATLSDDFREAAAAEIDLFKNEIVDRTGNREAAESLTDSDLLREVMNTVGKPGRLGGRVRCVVSVSMLTEGWDANNVTHILGLRAFGTQLICEQVIGRALRRSSYELGPDGHLAPEYADIFGIPFDFTGKAVVTPPTPPVNVTEVMALVERDSSAIGFPRVSGYRVDLGKERLSANWTPDSDFVLDPDVVGPCHTTNAPIVGAPAEMNADFLASTRPNTIVYNLTMRLIERNFRDAGQDPKLYLFGPLKAITEDWVLHHLHCTGGAFAAQILYAPLAENACNRITGAIVATQGDKAILPMMDPYNPLGTTANYYCKTAKTNLYKTGPRCHVNYAILDSNMEAELCRVLDESPAVDSWVKNDLLLGFRIPYQKNGENHEYVPDFIVGLKGGVLLVLETKGYRNEDAKEKANAARNFWVPAVNNAAIYGHWSFREFDSTFDIEKEFKSLVAEVLK